MGVVRPGVGGTETEVWIIAAQWRLCLISEVSRPIYWGMCQAQECCSTERLSLSGVQQVRTRGEEEVGAAVGERDRGRGRGKGRQG